MNYVLYHHGVKGMHWGVRRYQNKDGTRTPAGRKRYGSSSADLDEYGVKRHKEYTITTRSGEKLTMTPNQTYIKPLARVSKSYRELQSNNIDYDMKDSSGKKLETFRSRCRTAARPHTLTGFLRTSTVQEKVTEERPWNLLKNLPESKAPRRLLPKS